MNEGKKLCLICQEEIQAAATKCKHCGAHQNKIKRFFSRLAFVVGLTLSVASLVSIAVTSFMSITEENGVALNGTALHTDQQNRLRISIYNTGKIDAHLFDAIVTWPVTDGGSRVFKYGVRVMPEGIQKLVPAGQSRVLELVSIDGKGLPPMANPEVEVVEKIPLNIEPSCTVQVIYGANSGDRSFLEIPYKCLL